MQWTTLLLQFPYGSHQRANQESVPSPDSGLVGLCFYFQPSTGVPNNVLQKVACYFAWCLDNSAPESAYRE